MKLIYPAVISFSVLMMTWSFSATGQHSQHTDKPAVHGMVIFGTEKIYAYHLPMFHSPHNYQVILELQFDKETMLNLKRDQQLNTEHATYTIEPEVFILPQVIENPRPFKVNIFRGHFERGGVRIFSNVTAKIIDVLYFHQLDSTGERGETFKLLLFGNIKEQFAAHVLTNKPDFDQLLQVSMDPTLLKDSKYIEVDFPALENKAIGISGNAVNAFMLDRPVKTILLKQIYLEFADLE